MNYKKIYIKLIRKAQNRSKPECYCEKHHIFPESIFGKNNKIVVLTIKEHIFVHHLLCKYYNKKYGEKDKRTKKMLYAFSSMLNENIDIKIINLKTASIIREEYIKSICGEGNPMYGRKHKDETKNLISLKNTGKLGHKPSVENLEKLKKSHKGIPLSENQKKKISETRIKNGVAVGEKNPMYGKRGALNPKFGKKDDQETIKKKKESANPYKKAIIRIEPITGEEKEYESMSEAARDGFGTGNIWSCCNGKSKTYKKFIWKYKK